MRVVQALLVVPLIAILIGLVGYFYYRVLTRLRRKITRLQRRGISPVRTQLVSDGGFLASKADEAEVLWSAVACVLRIDPDLLRLSDRFSVDLLNPDDGILFDEVELLRDLFTEQCKERGLPVVRVPATLREYLKYLLRGAGGGPGGGGGGGGGSSGGGAGSGTGAGQSWSQCFSSCMDQYYGGTGWATCLGALGVDFLLGDTPKTEREKRYPHKGRETITRFRRWQVNSNRGVRHFFKRAAKVLYTGTVGKVVAAGSCGYAVGVSASCAGLCAADNNSF